MSKKSDKTTIEKALDIQPNKLHLKHTQVIKTKYVLHTPYQEPELTTGTSAANGYKPEVTELFPTTQTGCPRLVYINVELSNSIHAPKASRLAVRALHDSGCAKSILKLSTFNKLKTYGHVQVRRPEHTTVMVSATGQQTTITTEADIIMHFEGLNGVNLTFELNVMVHPSLAQDFLLGRDFTGSAAKAFETNDRIYLTDQLGAQSGTVQDLIKSKQLCEVPLITSDPTPMYVANNSATTIPPFSTVNVSCTLQKSPTHSYRLPIRTAGTTTYEVLNATYPRLETLPILHTFTKMDDIVISLKNISDDYVTLEPETMVAQIELWDDTETHEVHSVTVTSAEDSSESADKSLIPDFIQDDPALTEDEKEQAFMDYVRYGYHHPSMTKQVEDKAALTKMELQSVVEIPDSLFEKQFQIDHLPAKERELAIKIFRQTKAAFSRHAFDLGKAKDIKMSIPITTNQPHIQKYIPIPHSIRPQVREILDQYMERDIIRECDEPSPFCSNILVVKKADGKSIRLLLDGRLLNNYTQRLPTNLVTQMELLAHLVGKKWVTTIDLSDAFYQIELEPESQPLTAFYSEAHGKRYCFTRCPQGLRNSPLHLKLVMDRLFSHMANDVIHYADDIMIATDGSLTDHLKKLSDVFKKLEEGRIKIRPQKVKIAQDTVEFLGVIWKKDQILIPEARVLAFRNLPSPNSPKKLKSVICALSYYRKFVPNFANMSHELMELSTVHPKQFKWTDEHEKTFRTLIDCICKNSTLYLPDPKKPYYVQTDASDYCGAGRVFQKDDDGNEMPLACVSRTFTKTERSYSTVKKEVLALLYTLRTMDFFLRFANKIIILVDAAAILYLRMCKDAAGILLRFSLELSKYDAEIHHVKGENNEVADVLSRQHQEIDKLKDEVKSSRPMSEVQALEILAKLKIPKNYVFTADEVADMLEAPSLPHPDPAKKPKTSVAKTGHRAIKNLPTTLHSRKIKMPKEVHYAPGAKLPRQRSQAKDFSKKFENNQVNSLTAAQNLSYQDFSTISTAILSGTLNAKQFKEAQLADEFCSRIMDRLKKVRLERYALMQGLLFYKTKYICKLVLPNSLLDVLINAKHFSVFGLHFSKNRIMRDITSRYHVQGSELRNKLQMLKENCLICQFNASGQKDHELRRTDFIYAPRVTWAVDIIPNLPETVQGNKKAMLAVDMFTGYIQVCPMKDRTSGSLIEAIDTTIVRSFGVPRFIRSDNEPGLWTSNEFYEYLHPLGVKFFPTSVGSPWANGHAERSIRSIKEGLRTFLMQEKVVENWDKYINLFTQAHNQSTSIYGFSPEELMFGYKKPNANDLLEFWPNARSHSDYIAHIFPEIERKRNIALERSEKNKEKNRNFKNRNRVIKDFKIGQIVACRQLQVSTGPNSGMKPKHIGPYVILRVNDDKCSCIIEDMRNNSQSKEHFTNLIPINFHPDYNRLHCNFDEEINEMIENLKKGVYKIRPSTRRLLREPMLPDSEDELDLHVPDPTDDPTTTTLENEFETQDPDFGIINEDDSELKTDWQTQVQYSHEVEATQHEHEAHGTDEEDDGNDPNETDVEPEPPDDNDVHDQSIDSQLDDRDTDMFSQLPNVGSSEADEDDRNPFEDD